MNSPYANMYRSQQDQLIVLSLVVAWLVIGTLLFRTGSRGVTGTEAFLQAFARAFLSLTFGIMAVFALGVLLFLWPSVFGVIGYVWELFYLLSVVAVFWTLPGFAVLLLAWAWVGRRQGRYAPRSFWLASAGGLALVGTVILYYLLELILAYQAKTGHLS